MAYPASVSELSRKLEQSNDNADELQRKLNRIADRYQQVHHEYIDTKFSVRRTQKKIRANEARLASRQRLLSRRANFMYRHGDVQIADVLLGANSFTEFIVRIDFLFRLADSDSQLIGEIRTTQDRLERDRNFLRAKMERQAKIAEDMKAEARELDRLLARRQAESARLARQLRSERARALQASYYFSRRGTFSGGGRAVGLIFKRGGYVFPVAGPHAYSSTFGAPRGGGTRRHQGNDIFGRRGTPLVAVTAGSVTRRSGGIGGLAVWLHGRDGNCYYYAHLDGFAAAGSVSAGTVIGYLGDTGNARGTSPHLHFEIHPGCGRAVDPYGILRSWE